LDINIDASRPIIFAADLHLKPQWSTVLPAVTEDSSVGLDELRRVIADTDAAAIILGGDIFDQNMVKHLWLQQLFFAWVDQVTSSGCQVLAYPGNHDYVLHQLDEDAPVHIHSIHPGVIDIDGRCFKHGDRVYGCVGHRDYPATLMNDIRDLPPEVDTLLLHQLIVHHGGSTNLNDVPDHIRTIVLGDVHEFSDGETTTGAWWGYPSCMFPQNIAEKDHGVFVISSDPRTAPMRKGIAARSARAFDISDEVEIASQLAIAAAWVKEQRHAIQELIDADQGRSYLRGVKRPVVQFRVARTFIGEMKKAIAHNEIGDEAHVQVKPISVLKRVDFDAREVTTAVPTPIDLLPAFAKRIEESEAIRVANCPYTAESASLVRDLLLAGGAGRRAGDDARQANGKPLAHSALIAAALAELDTEEDSNA